MNNVFTESELLQLEKRKKELLSQILNVRTTYMGLNYSLDDIIRINGNLDMPQVGAFVSDLLELTDCRAEMKRFFEELYYCIVLYIDISCNRLDRILLSIYKIAETFNKVSTKKYFKNTPFGIMIGDTLERPRFHYPEETTEAVPVIEILEAHAASLQEEYDGLKGYFSADRIVLEALEEYTLRAGISCLNDDNLFSKATSSLRASMMNSRYTMREKKDVKNYE